MKRLFYDVLKEKMNYKEFIFHVSLMYIIFTSSKFAPYLVDDKIIFFC